MVVTGVSSFWVTVYWGGTVTAWYEISRVRDFVVRGLQGVREYDLIRVFT